MKRSIRAALVATTLSAVGMVPAVALVTVATADAAFAKNGNGNGKGNGGGKSAEARGGGAKDKASRGGGKPSWAGNGGKGGNSAKRGGPDPVGDFLKKLTGQDKKEARQQAKYAPTKNAPERSVSPAKKPARFSDMHPRDLGNMNGALNANINAVLAHIRNGNTNGPVGHLALLAVADANLAEAQATLDLAADFDDLDAALADAGFDSVDDYYEALKAGEVSVDDEELADLNDAIAALGGDAESGLGIGVEAPSVEEFDAATEALPELEAAQLDAEQKILDYWNKNPGEVVEEAALEAVETEGVEDGTMEPDYSDAEEELLEDLRDRLVGYESDIGEAIDTPKGDGEDDTAECDETEGCDGAAETEELAAAE